MTEPGKVVWWQETSVKPGTHTPTELPNIIHTSNKNTLEEGISWSHCTTPRHIYTLHIKVCPHPTNCQFWHIQGCYSEFTQCVEGTHVQHALTGYNVCSTLTDQWSVSCQSTLCELVLWAVCLTPLADWSYYTVLHIICYEMTLLWEGKHSTHYNKRLCNEVWIETPQKTGKIVMECKKEVTSLLDVMRKEMKRSIGTGRGE